VADHHLITGSEPIYPYRDFRPVPGDLSHGTEMPRGLRKSPYRPYRVASRGGTGSAIAFIRDPRSTLQVWSRDAGYPGDPGYLEFHKKHFPGGLRFWRVTDGLNDLGTKQVYDPEVAASRTRAHAEHFTSLLWETFQAAGPRTLVCSPYDAELFGHWWFEGPQWLEWVVRTLARTEMAPATLGESLEIVKPLDTVALPEGSWGEGGDHRVWFNRDTEWTWDRVYSAEDEWASHLSRLDGTNADARRVLTQASRELLLLEASDWQFLITTGTARDYAERRVAEHYAEFKRLLEMARLLDAGEQPTPEMFETLRRLERQDFCFPDLDPSWALGRPDNVGVTT
jgi:1,4-alpha-glucan branching enzyme